MKDNLKNTKGTMSMSQYVEVSATAGVGKKEAGLGWSAEKEAASVDLDTGQVEGAKPTRIEHVLESQS